MRLAALLLLALVLAGCAARNEGLGPADHVVLIPGERYEPPVLNVTAGDVVEWRNTDTVRHTVTPSDARVWGNEGSGSAEDDWLTEGATWTHRFDAPGIYDYYCIPHGGVNADGSLRGQTGRVVVLAAAAPAG